MKQKFIEFASLVVDIANITDNQSTVDHSYTNSLPLKHKGIVKLLDKNGIYIDDIRFESKCNIFPNVLSTVAQRLNQALHIDEYAYQLFVYDFDKKIIVPSKNPSAISEKIIDILSFATKYDCLKYEHFYNADREINQLIYLESSYVIGLLNRHNIRHLFGPDAISDACVEKQPKETHKELFDRLTKEGCDEKKIIRELIALPPKISDYRLGILMKPSPVPNSEGSKKIADCYRKRGEKLRKTLLKEI